jgi:hypothetical protein
MPEPIAYKDVLAGNIRAARARADLSQAALAARMKALGFTQIYGATIGAIERSARTLGAVEIAGISLCLNTTVSALMLPTLEAGSTVIFPNGDRVPSQRLAIIDDSVSWDGNTPKITPPTETYRPADVIAAIHATLQAVRESSALAPPPPNDQGAADIRPYRPGEPPSEPLKWGNDQEEGHGQDPDSDAGQR